RQARDRVGTFPPVMERLSGNEAEELTGLRRQATTLKDEEGRCRAAIEVARRDLEACRLPGEGVSVEQIATLRARLNELKDCERELEACAKQRREAEAVCAKAAEELGASLLE